MTRWRYKLFTATVTLSVGGAQDLETPAIEDKLNAIGDQGWEIYEQKFHKRLIEDEDDYYNSTIRVTIQVWAKQPVLGHPYR